jgi:hypothetical protein
MLFLVEHEDVWSLGSGSCVAGLALSSLKDFIVFITIMIYLFGRISEFMSSKQMYL